MNFGKFNPVMLMQSLPALRKPVILAVDDDPNNLAVVRDCLQDLDYSFLVAEDGESAVARADYARPDLILLDIMMPGIDGFETCRRLKSLENTNDIPIIFMSALAETSQKVQGLEAGAVDYITKPFQREELLARIAVHLHIRELTRRLQESKQSLEIRVAERTAELARTNAELLNEISERKRAEQEKLKLEKDLHQAQKMEAIGTLAAGIAHDFNNILTAIIGFSEMSLAKLENGECVRSDLERVLESGLRATDLVKQILSFSRQKDLERQPVPTALVVKEVLRLLRSSLPTTIEFRQNIEIRPEESIVDADPTQLHQVLMNLCTNAGHAMRANGGVLSVNLSKVDVDAHLVSIYPDLRPGPHVKLTVGDTGHGMDNVVMEQIFEPYFTTKGSGEGTGMGLSMTMSIIKSHGGAISVSSEPGQGTVFDVYFPRTEGDIVRNTEAEGPLPTGNERILFVDDEKTLAVLGQQMLGVLGYHVTAVTSSLEALKIFRAQPDAFDLVITDMTMPGLTGRELARELLAIRADIPVIMCSGISEFLNEEDARRAGIREFFMKPYVISNLAKTIRKVF